MIRKLFARLKQQFCQHRYQRVRHVAVSRWEPGMFVANGIGGPVPIPCAHRMVRVKVKCGLCAKELLTQGRETQLAGFHNSVEYLVPTR